MSGRMNWWRSGKDMKPSLSIQDERENEAAGRDRADKWLAKKQAEIEQATSKPHAKKARQ